MKWVKYIEYVLLAISVIVIASLFFLPKMEFKGSAVFETDWLLYWAYAMLVLGVIAALIAPVMSLFTNPKGTLRALIGLVVAVVLIGVCYAFSSTAPVPNSAGGYFENPAELRLTDTMLYLTYAIGATSVLVILYTEIRNAFK